MLCRNIGVIRPHPTAALAIIGGIALHITRDGKALNVKARQRNLRQPIILSNVKEVSQSGASC